MIDSIGAINANKGSIKIFWFLQDDEHHILFFSFASRIIRPISAPIISVSTGMDSSRGQNGIQLLLAAEQEAQQIVNAARNAKLARLKQAKEEAEKEVAEFRAQMEADFQRKLAETSGDSGANVKRLEKETDAKIQHLKGEAERISSDVVEMLLKHITTVRY
ncbi:hypothetical protein L1987_52190 [Smallanthus sonchifolius]|uniref:Uncharacterized protein n=1 Tax=Smallanthus sonchifolius TaxID=185202 RepID=A0ACB9ERS5_9ASTR|nr:hypothetical protein L1987_52190 [Smallanthus sonchifolius]